MPAAFAESTLDGICSDAGHHTRWRIVRAVVADGVATLALTRGKALPIGYATRMES